MIYYDGTLVGADPDLAYEQAAEIAAETRQRRKLLDLYYDCAKFLDEQNEIGLGNSETKIRICLNKFFQKELNKSL